eukprot:IDg6124t1
MLNPTVELAGRTAFSTTVLDRVSKRLRLSIMDKYSSGVYVSLRIDGWLTPTSLKLLGFCRLLKCIHTGDIAVDVSRFEEVIESSRLVSIVTDSVASNVGAKKKLARKYPEIIFVSCFAHQLNLMACNVLTHQSTKDVLSSARDV